MEFEIRETPFHVSLVGFGDTVTDERYAETGMRLMDQMWREVRSRGLRNAGTNYWVYLPESRLFAGVELKNEIDDRGPLEAHDVSLARHLRYVHKGEYSELPKVWRALFAELRKQGETPARLGVEIYDHCHEDPAENETTVLIGLKPRGEGGA